MHNTLTRGAGFKKRASLPGEAAKPVAKIQHILHPGLIKIILRGDNSLTDNEFGGLQRCRDHFKLRHLAVMNCPSVSICPFGICSLIIISFTLNEAVGFVFFRKSLFPFSIDCRIENRILMNITQVVFGLPNGCSSFDSRKLLMYKKNEIRFERQVVFVMKPVVCREHLSIAGRPTTPL